MAADGTPGRRPGTKNGAAGKQPHSWPRWAQAGRLPLARFPRRTACRCAVRCCTACSNRALHALPQGAAKKDLLPQKCRLQHVQLTAAGPSRPLLVQGCAPAGSWPQCPDSAAAASAAAAGPPACMHACMHAVLAHRIPPASTDSHKTCSQRHAIRMTLLAVVPICVCRCRPFDGQDTRMSSYHTQ